MKLLKINLSDEQIEVILGEGDKNPLYEHLLKSCPEYSPIPTIESLYKEGKIGGYWLDNSIIHYEDYINSSIEAVDGVAPNREAVERTVIEYKLLHLIKANNLEGDTHTIVYDRISKVILINDIVYIVGSVLRLGGSEQERNKFVKNYESLILEYFSTFNA